MHVYDEAGEILSSYTLPILTKAPGGFLVFGVLIAIVNKIGRQHGKKTVKEFSCEGCPSAGICGKTSCSDMIEVTHEINTVAAQDVPREEVKEGE